ncbi:hypothetical protein HPB50_001026 [Hyalomma asiaticum]|uniref:Uncharacterized protein n=1 Tax=Hyalomma asiaticum TaxID=266040 RepID=A0ACB7RUI6_HYAAI|nr:hypothetical protein HPB50_001026 [Hyalomma asiaticum]
MKKRKRENRDTTCFVPGCTSGYRSCKEKWSLFRVPKEPERREEWSQLIHRTDRELNEACTICERHFEPRYIERSYETTVNGEIVEIPRGLPLLSKDAVPSLFERAKRTNEAP